MAGQFFGLQACTDAIASVKWGVNGRSGYQADLVEGGWRLPAAVDNLARSWIDIAGRFNGYLHTVVKAHQVLATRVGIGEGQAAQAGGLNKTHIDDLVFASNQPGMELAA